MTRRYPLDPLKRVRAEKVDERTRSLSGALRESELAARRASDAALVKVQVEEAMRATAHAERALLERGELSAGDLSREAEWRVGAEKQREQAARAAVRAEQERLSALSAAEQERLRLLSAKADSQVVEKHHDRWQKADHAARLAGEEETAEEAFLGSRRGDIHR